MTDIPEDVRAVFAAADKAVRDREDMMRRVLTDRVAHAVAHIVRRALASHEGHGQTITDATVGIMAIVDGSEAPSDDSRICIPSRNRLGKQHRGETPMSQPTNQETGLAFVDGRDALAYVILRPNEHGTGIVMEVAANGISKEQAAYALRHVADGWDPQDAVDQAFLRGYNAATGTVQAALADALKDGRGARARTLEELLTSLYKQSPPKVGTKHETADDTTVPAAGPPEVTSA